MAKVPSAVAVMLRFFPRKSLTVIVPVPVAVTVSPVRKTQPSGFDTVNSVAKRRPPTRKAVQKIVFFMMIPLLFIVANSGIQSVGRSRGAVNKKETVDIPAGQQRCPATGPPVQKERVDLRSRS